VIVVSNDSRTGTVVIRDDRNDGSYVYLLCQELHAHEPGGGIIVAPDPPEYFPTGAVDRAAHLHAESTGKSAFSLDVHIGEMPPGEIAFRQSSFVTKAIEESQRGERTWITPQNADEWGYVELDMPLGA
jgi:hypothetical protein